MQLKLIIKHSLFRRIHTHCLLPSICIHADKTWCRHTWRFSPLFSTSIYHPDIPLWRASKGWILPHDRSLYKFALPNQMVSVKLWQQWAGFRAKYLLKSVLYLAISANIRGAPNLVSQDMAFVEDLNTALDQWQDLTSELVWIHHVGLCAVALDTSHTATARLLWSKLISRLSFKAVQRE